MDAAERDAWRMESFAASYREWIADEMGRSGYSILFDILYGIEFQWTLERDADRAEAGKDLRLRFENISGMTCRDEWLDWPCSFLEMLVGLAYSMEDHVLYDGTKGDRSAEWFWMILGNLGLDVCTDTWMRLTPGSSSFVERTVKCVIERAYSPDGYGGMFPLRYPESDQRTVEIWYQAHAYILENAIE